MARVFFTCNNYTFSAQTQQAEDFLYALCERDWTKFTSAAKLFTIALRSGSPPAGRAKRVSGSKVGLFELKITAPGSTGPQKRMLCRVRGKSVQCIHGVDKRQPHLSAADIKTAEKAIFEYDRRSNEFARSKKRGKKKE